MPRWAERFASLVHLLPPLGIFLVVVGSIYAGIATPTEAASLGVVAALGLAWAYGRLSLAMLKEVFENSMRTTAMMMLIIVAAYFLNFVMSAIGLTAVLTDSSPGWACRKWQMLLAVVVFYLVLGCFMETLSMMITTIPIIAPVMFALGFDPVWFGIVLVILIEMALITPPVGLNLFVVQSLRDRGSLNDVMAGSAPFVVAMLAMIGLLALFPGLATVAAGAGRLNRCRLSTVPLTNCGGCLAPFRTSLAGPARSHSRALRQPDRRRVDRP